MNRTSGRTSGATATDVSDRPNLVAIPGEIRPIYRMREELGRRVLMPLTEVAPDTTVALFADPEGHVVGLM